MTTVINSIDITGLRKVHFDQLLSYIEEREQEGWYYGPQKQFENRHEELKIWVEGIIELLGSEGIIIPKGVK